jgi:hypothetical protein
VAAAVWYERWEDKTNQVPTNAVSLCTIAYISTFTWLGKKEVYMIKYLELFFTLFFFYLWTQLELFWVQKHFIIVFVNKLWKRSHLGSINWIKIITIIITRF